MAASTQRVALTRTFTYVNGSTVEPIANQQVTVTNQNGTGATVYNALTGGSTVSAVTTDSTGNLNGATNSYFVEEGSYIINVPSGTGYGAFSVYFEAVHGAGVGNLSTTLAQTIYQSGDLKPSAVPTAPSGWLLCDGSSYATTLYPDLYAAIGTTYGETGGTGYFNVPDLVGRLPLGAGTGSAVGATAWALGQQPTSGPGGEQTHLQVLAEMPIHNHGINDPGHGHAIARDINSGSLTSSINAPLGISYYVTALQTQAATTGITIQNAGGNTPMNILPPVSVINWFIKT